MFMTERQKRFDRDEGDKKIEQRFEDADFEDQRDTATSQAVAAATRNQKRQGMHCLQEHPKGAQT